MRLNDIYFDSISTIFQLDFGTSDSVVLFDFHFLLLLTL